MPYMSIELMLPPEPVEHRLEHDLKSVVLVILHILRFTWEPTANPVDEGKPCCFKLAIGHHEPAVELIKQHKICDITQWRKNPEAFITNYWKPIAPFLPKLIDIIYPQGVGVTGPATCRLFNEVLTAARDYCKTLQEVTSNYAAFVTKKRKGSTRDRGKAKQVRPPQKDTVNTPHRSSRSSHHVSSGCDHQASGPADWLIIL